MPLTMYKEVRSLFCESAKSLLRSGFTWLCFLISAASLLADTPLNDNFADRTPLVGLPVSTPAVALYAATREPGEPEHPGATGGHTVWWSWTAPRTTKILVQRLGFPTAAVAFYTGTALTNLTLWSAGITPDGGRLPINVEAGQTYQIVAGFGDFMDYNDMLLLEMDEAVIPPNDLFANRTAIMGTNISI